MDWWFSCRISALQSVVAVSISNGRDRGILCWWDLIRSKQLSCVSVCRAQVFAGFSGNSIHNINSPFCFGLSLPLWTRLELEYFNLQRICKHDVRLDDYAAGNAWNTDKIRTQRSRSIKRYPEETVLQKRVSFKLVKMSFCRLSLTFFWGLFCLFVSCIMFFVGFLHVCLRGSCSCFIFEFLLPAAFRLSNRGSPTCWIKTGRLIS